MMILPRRVWPTAEPPLPAAGSFVARARTALVVRPCDPQAVWRGGFCLRRHRDCTAPRLGSDPAISAPRSAAASCARALRSRRAAFPGRQPAGARLPAAGARERRSRWCPRAGCFQDEDQQEQQQDGAERRGDPALRWSGYVSALAARAAAPVRGPRMDGGRRAAGLRAGDRDRLDEPDALPRTAPASEQQGCDPSVTVSS